MENVDERLFVSEIFVPTIDWEIKEADEYDRHRMRYSRPKDTRNNMNVSGSISGI